MDKKKVRVLKYQDHPEMENKVVECVIIGIENTKPRMRSKITPRKPKQSRMTIMQLALEMRAGFAAINNRMDVEFATINKRIDKLEVEVAGIKAVLKRNNLH
jgi:hypothetical protein